MLDIKYRFTCSDSGVSEVVTKCQNIMTRIVEIHNGRLAKNDFEEIVVYNVLCYH